MGKERILITVKTYPTLSKKYGETVCTAGVRKDGSWVRIYPVHFRRLEEAEQYRKFDWLECDLIKHQKDLRPESHFPANPKQLVAVDHMDTSGGWRERRKLLLEKATVFTRLEPLIAEAKSNQRSLAVFKPSCIRRFLWEEEEPEWDPAKLNAMRNHFDQGELFDEEPWRKTFQIIPKLPFSFSYEFEDADGKKSELQILDWEIGALYWNCMRRSNNEKTTALNKVRMKYEEQFLKTDLHFFLGTTQQFHLRAPNPWVIIGVFPIPPQLQPELF